MVNQEEYGNIVKACVLLAENAEAGNAFSVVHIQKALAGIWSSKARAASFNSHLWNFDSTNAGYLVGKSNSLSIKVPVHLVEALPGAEELSELCHVAGEVKISKESSICLSGSALLFDSVSCISDIDCCEYVNIADTTLRDGLLNTITKQSNGICAWKVKCINSSESVELWTRGRYGNSDHYNKILDELLPDNYVFACDYVANTRCAGAIEATNRVLRIDPKRPDEGAWLKSFPHQEAPLVKNQWVPRDLSSPVMLGNYISWLIRKTEQLVIEAENDRMLFVKAAKRALSLCRVLFLGDVAEELRNCIDEHGALRFSAISARRKTLSELSTSNDECLREFCNKLQSSIDEIHLGGNPCGLEGDNRKDEVEPFAEGIEAIINKALGQARKLAYGAKYGY